VVVKVHITTEEIFQEILPASFLRKFLVNTKQLEAAEVCLIVEEQNLVQDLVMAAQAAAALADIITQKVDSGHKHQQDTELLQTITGTKVLWSRLVILGVAVLETAEIKFLWKATAMVAA
jgi:hypothetical protein